MSPAPFALKNGKLTKLLGQPVLLCLEFKADELSPLALPPIRRLRHEFPSSFRIGFEDRFFQGDEGGSVERRVGFEDLADVRLRDGWEVDVQVREAVVENRVFIERVLA